MAPLCFQDGLNAICKIIEKQALMKIAIMQPYFLPYIGYFSLIKHTDRFILLDEVQFIRHGWIERNRVLKENDGWLYIKVPLKKHNRDSLIKEVLIDSTRINWQQKISAQIKHYKKYAPYYSQVLRLLRRIFSVKYSRIAELNKQALEIICDYLNIHSEIEIFSEMKINIEKPKAPDEWALNICKAIGNVKEYWNPPGGQHFFDRKKYQKQNINLKFHKLNFIEYDQRRQPFIPLLSVIDTMMFNSVEEVNTMLDNYELT